MVLFTSRIISNTTITKPCNLFLKVSWVNFYSYFFISLQGATFASKAAPPFVLFVNKNDPIILPSGCGSDAQLMYTKC